MRCSSRPLQYMHTQATCMLRDASMVLSMYDSKRLMVIGYLYTDKHTYSFLESVPNQYE